MIIIADAKELCNNETMTQEQKVLAYITKYGSIDTWRAYSDLHITRLSARIYRLKKDGYRIVGTTITKDTPNGVKTWKEYKYA